MKAKLQIDGCVMLSTNVRRPCHSESLNSLLAIHGLSHLKRLVTLESNLEAQDPSLVR